MTDGAQALPGFEAMMDLWPNVDGHRVTHVAIRFGGNYDVTDQPDLARALALGGLFEFTVQARLVDKKQHVTDDKETSGRQATGVAALKILSLEPTGHMQERLSKVVVEGEVTKKSSRRQKVTVDGNTGLVTEVVDEPSELTKALAAALDEGE